MSLDNRKEITKNENNIKESQKNAEITEKVGENTKRCIESMSDDEIIQENLKELLEKKSREERKANGRLVAVILVFLVIFLAIYHVWIRKTKGLAGVLVPAVIMLSYGGWVVILAKRDKQKQALFEKHLQEIVERNKTELEKTRLIKQQKQQLDTASSSTTTTTATAATTANKVNDTTKLYFENEIRNQSKAKPATINTKEHRKYRRHRNRRADSTTTTNSICSTSSSSSAGSTIVKEVRTKRPSIRQKLFKQKAELNLADGMVRAVGPATTVAPLMASVTTKQARKKHLQRLDTINKTPLVRMTSVP